MSENNPAQNLLDACIAACDRVRKTADAEGNCYTGDIAAWCVDSLREDPAVLQGVQGLQDALAENAHLREENAALAAWECAECHARFPDICPPAMLENVRRCSRCVEVERLNAILADATALRFPAGNGIDWWAEERDGVWVSYCRDALRIERDCEEAPKAWAIYRAQVNAAKEQGDA